MKAKLTFDLPDDRTDYIICTKHRKTTLNANKLME